MKNFMPVDNLKRKRPFCFGTMVLRFLTFFCDPSLIFYKGSEGSEGSEN